MTTSGETPHEPDAETAPATSLLFDVFATSQAVGRLLAGAMRDGPLTPSEYAISSAIFELEAATPTALATRLGMPLTTLADHLRAIERRGHAARLPHPSDRRSYRVVLTASGRAAHRAANAGFEAAHRAFTAALPAGEARARAGLADIRAAADAAADEAAGAAVVASRRPSGGRGG
ncbi:MAG TPA: MarR family transcriptional regulator [Candidatus Limnocylindrales bacterium]|nr:MarR family transcriptional regulator [Candidatus Limnocylindrales bacterium]